jgi:hypothetical protein
MDPHTPNPCPDHTHTTFCFLVADWAGMGRLLLPETDVRLYSAHDIGWRRGGLKDAARQSECGPRQKKRAALRGRICS